MNKLLILPAIILLLYFNYSIPYQVNNKIYQIQPKNTYNVQKYISNNKLSPYILYTVINNCCECIMIYHNFYDKFHGNTNLQNFYMYENCECVLLYNNTNSILENNINNTNITNNTNYTLNKTKRFKDYSIFFKSCKKELTNYNKYFFRIFNKYRLTIIKSLFIIKKMV
jgi:hypothetical protein